MSMIEVSCPDCGPVTCEAARFQLRTYDGADAWYVFECPKCNRMVQRPADERAVRILAEEGAFRLDKDIPQEVFERHDGPLFTANDVIEFHLLLEQPDWFTSVVRRPSER